MAQLAAARNPVLDAATKFVLGIDICSEEHIIGCRIASSPALYVNSGGEFHSEEKVMSLRKLASNLAAGVAYPGHRHFAQRLLNRRTFLEKSGITLGALAASGILPELARAATLKTHGHNGTTAATPLPIPGGLQLLGPDGPLFHVFLPAPGAEPSTITNFNGFVGWAAVGGMGTHTVTGQAPEHLPFEADVRFMRGEFVGADGRNHHGAFCFI